MCFSNSEAFFSTDGKQKIGARVMTNGAKKNKYWHFPTNKSGVASNDGIFSDKIRVMTGRAQTVILTPPWMQPWS